MNAQRKHSHDSAHDALRTFSETLDASAHEAMQAAGYIESNPGSANSDRGRQESACPLRLVHRQARQLSRLIKVIGDDFGENPGKIQDAEIVGLAADLAESIYKHFESATDAGPKGAYVKSAHLMAVVFSMYTSIPQCARAATNEDRLALANRFGWLQDAANDLAKELVECLGETE